MAKRQPRQRTDTRRKGQSQKSAGQTVLIVCEGTKTELNYFKELRREYKLQAVHAVEVTAGSSGRNAKNILHDAKKRYKVSKEKGDAFDRVYCVFDQDDEMGANTGFREVIVEIDKMTDFYAAYSVPSFEFWLLLHFPPYSRPSCLTPKQVFDHLQKVYPQYDKKRVGIFLELHDKLDQALGHADRCNKEAEECGEDNPSTQIHNLVRFLQELRDVR